MKKLTGIIICLLAILLCACASADVEINAVNFPDRLFRDYVSYDLDRDGDGWLSDAEIQSVDELEIYELGIESLKGIEYFTALTSLDCSFNFLESLDVSKNTALTHLRCDYNAIKTLNISRNAALTELLCVSNRLTTLDTSKNTALEMLDCTYNRLSKLTLGKNAVLSRVKCDHNKLSTLDISGCGKLVKITGGAGPSQCVIHGDKSYGWLVGQYEYLLFDKGLGIVSKQKDRISSGGLVFILNHQKKTAAVTGAVKKTIQKAAIPASVRANGKAYKVTAVGIYAFSNLKNLATLIIGSNIAEIGTEAFYNCPKLKSVTIKTAKLTETKVGSNAFGKNHKKAVYKCPAKKLKAYRKFLIKKGVPKAEQIQ